MHSTPYNCLGIYSTPYVFLHFVLSHYLQVMHLHNRLLIRCSIFRMTCDVIIFCNVHARARNYIEDEVRTCNGCTVVSSVCVAYSVAYRDQLKNTIPRARTIGDVISGHAQHINYFRLQLITFRPL